MYSEKSTKYIPRVLALQYYFSLHFLFELVACCDVLFRRHSDIGLFWEATTPNLGAYRPKE